MHEDGLALPQRRYAILVTALGTVMSMMDATIANVALPTIARDLGTTASASIWVVNAYQFTVTMLLVPLASLGDIVGYARVFRVGLAVFVLGSLACVASHSLLALTLAYLFWYRGVKVLGPTRSAMYSNLQPVVALVVAWFALGEQPTIIQVLGAAAIMIGLLLTRA